MFGFLERTTYNHLMITADLVRLRVHASVRMLQRGITLADVLTVINTGERIESSPEVKPFGKRLMLGVVAGRPLHVACANAPDGTVHVFTVYEPNPALWADNFRRRVK